MSLFCESNFSAEIISSARTWDWKVALLLQSLSTNIFKPHLFIKYIWQQKFVNFSAPEVFVNNKFSTTFFKYLIFLSVLSVLSVPSVLVSIKYEQNPGLYFFVILEILNAMKIDQKWTGGRYRAARVAKIITLSPPCGCCSVISVGLGRRHDCRITLTISTSPTEDMFQDKKKQCPKIKRFPKISQFQIYHLRLMD